MQVKKYEAKTMQEALETIKRELGPDAIILKTRENKKGFGLLSKGSVEVTVAIAEKMLEKKKTAEKHLTESGRAQADRAPAIKQTQLFEKILDKKYARLLDETKDKLDIRSLAKPMDSARPSQRYIDIEDSIPKSLLKAQDEEVVLRQQTAKKERESLEEELKGLRKIILDMKGNVTEKPKDNTDSSSWDGARISQNSVVSLGLQEIVDELLFAGVERRYALSLARQVELALGSERAKQPDTVRDQMANEIMDGILVKSFLGNVQPNSQDGPKIFAVVGPTGVGKTTTIAKLASEATLKRKLKVGLINIDTYKIGAADQLATYSKILNVPFRTVKNREEILLAIKDFRPLDLVLVDTTGRSPKDTESLLEMKEALDSIVGLETTMVLSANTRDTEVMDAVKRFGMFNPRGLIFSKLDECLSYGTIYNVQQKTRLPLEYFSTGQRVPEDLEESTPERLASLILGIG